MTLANFRILSRAYIPGNKVSVITNDVLDLIINNGVKDIARYTCCLKANKKFNAVAEQREYNLSTVIGDYLTPDKSGLWWNAGSATSTDYKQLNPRTLNWLDINRRAWRDFSSGDPQDYTIDGDILTVVNKPDAALTDGFWLYYGKSPVVMTSPEDYPFSGSTSEFTHLAVFDDAILEYCRWKINPMLNKDQTVDITEGSYKRAREEAFLVFKRRKDITHNSDTRLTPRI